MSLPTVTIVGRPNVGKSSLLNRLAGRRVSIVEPTAGVTRDRVSILVQNEGRTFELVDTGGLGLVDDELLKEHIEAQIAVALQEADLILFVVDAKDGLVPGDEMVAQRLRRLDKEAMLVVNKVESRWEEYSVSEWIKLGFGEPLAISAKEGFGVTDLMQAVTDKLSFEGAIEAVEAGLDSDSAGEGADGEVGDDFPEITEDTPLRFAVVGKRNSGKSTLINQLVGEERVIVSEVPGTTRDSVDVEFLFGERRMVAIDTAGVRKKRSIEDAIEFYSYARSLQSIRRAEIVLHMFDIQSDISQVDKKVAEYAMNQSKPVVLVGNKTDLVDQLEMEKWDAYIRQQLPGLSYAPVSFISAKEGEQIEDTLGLLFELRQQSSRRIQTAELNDALQRAKQKLSPRSKSVIPKLFYATQIRANPVTILLFVNEPSIFRGQYERYLQNFLREEFDCPEVPFKLVFRKRQKVKLDPA